MEAKNYEENVSRLPESSVTYGDDDGGSGEFNEFTGREVANGFSLQYNGLDYVFLNKKEMLKFLEENL